MLIGGIHLSIRMPQLRCYSVVLSSYLVNEVCDLIRRVLDLILRVFDLIQRILDHIAIISFQCILHCGCLTCGMCGYVDVWVF